LERKLNRKIYAFAYPWGDYGKKLLEVVRKFYSLAFTVEKGNVEERTGPLRIPRIYAVKDPFTFIGHLWKYAR
jgi:hypothetical protein